ncbi:Helix-turn-helix domain-containing protein [Alkalithermobacter thermoalcaliphilus JW-YL-7 = DSM 7308]|uniref:Helix-turn-helix domain-containing protein n=1 Tax=Alkalithermobacter thermoalcaliphilus JW-YL-7 = DSM 7308 TaxID=1121328 RepID=A0A150FP49_CLOPD|nr:PBS lyase HEAT domain protein repeat-containing protein [[Clostridium] paradoxum JW-YL-7 = DSM 7308]SHK53098.1 Helix-turn-helix domain-containing protein [[Clostridium] paradoxum JW-YL-7 = DSM 7308]
MELKWDDIESLRDYQITYLLYKEGKNIYQISKIRNISVEQVNMHLISAKQEIKDMFKSEKDIITKLLEMNKEERINTIGSLNFEQIEVLKRKLYKRILKEENAEDLMVLIWICGELKDCRLLKLIHSNSNHPHGGVRRMAYSAMGKIGAKESIQFLNKGIMDKKPQVRQYAAKALSKIGDKDSLKKLENLIKNPNEKEYVKKAFFEAIESIKKRY